MFFKKGVLKNFAKLTGKQLWRSVFKYSCSLDVFFIKKGIPAQVFPCEVYDILGKPFYITRPATSAEMWKTIERKQTNINKHYSLKTVSFAQKKHTNGNKISIKPNTLYKVQNPITDFMFILQNLEKSVMNRSFEK